MSGATLLFTLYAFVALTGIILPFLTTVSGHSCCKISIHIITLCLPFHLRFGLSPVTFFAVCQVKTVYALFAPPSSVTSPTHFTVVLIMMRFDRETERKDTLCSRKRAWGDHIQIDLKPYRSSVELISTALYVVRRPMSSSNRHVTLQCFVFVFRTLPLSSGCFWNVKIREFVENWLGQYCWNSQDSLWLQMVK
jgi:hypothetical protein